jgi:tripartite-type tricarboxylate transporter receptor subunit TctC
MSVGTGDVNWGFGTIPSSSGAYRAGKLKYLAVAAKQRIPAMPEVPTFAEAGGPAGFELNSFVVLVAPKGLPAALRARIHADVAKAVAEPDVKARYDTFAFEVLNWSPDDIVRNAEARSKVYERLVKRANITLD